MVNKIEKKGAGESPAKPDPFQLSWQYQGCGSGSHRSYGEKTIVCVSLITAEGQSILHTT
jgi:hypothetical protein